MIKNKNLALLRFSLLIFVSHSEVSHAQVTIGSDAPPLLGALFQIKEYENVASNSNLGLEIPRFKPTSKTNLHPIFETVPDNSIPNNDYNNATKKVAQNAVHIGLVVFHVDQCTMQGKGLYVWAQNGWTKQYNKCSFFQIFYRSIRFFRLIAIHHVITSLLPPHLSPKGKSWYAMPRNYITFWRFVVILSPLFWRGRGEVRGVQNTSFRFCNDVLLASFEISSSVVSNILRLVKVREGYVVNILLQSGNWLLYSPSKIPEGRFLSDATNQKNKFKNYINKQKLILSRCRFASKSPLGEVGGAKKLLHK